MILRLINNPEKRADPFIVFIDRETRYKTHCQIRAERYFYLWANGHFKSSVADFFIHLNTDKVVGMRNGVMK